MNKLFLRSTGFVLLLMVNIFSSCQKEEDTRLTPAMEIEETKENELTSRANNAIPDLNKLADTLAWRLKNNVVGYSIIVSYKNQASVHRSGGLARTTANAPSIPMTISTHYSAASIAKTISATALIHVLSNFPNGYHMIDWPIWPYLPSHWALGDNIKSITFRDLLTHKSGFRNMSLPNGGNTGNQCSYANLKALVAAGVSGFNMGTESYNNRNFALMRLLIPVLAKKYQITKYDPNIPLATIETKQATEMANAYKDYCQKKIFSQLITCVLDMPDCVNNHVPQGLSYIFNPGNTTGQAMGDLTMSSGGQGWVLTTAQMYDFFRTLHYTDKILPKILTDLMKVEKLGYDAYSQTTDKITYYWKNGIYDWGLNGASGGYRSLIIGFGDDIQISVMTNSPINLQSNAIAAHQDWHP